MNRSLRFSQRRPIPCMGSWTALAIAVCAVAFSGCAHHGPPVGAKAGQLLIGARTSAALNGLQDPDAEVRRWSLVVLAQDGDLSFAEAFGLLLDPKNEPVPLVRATAAAGLRTLGDKRALPSLASACKDFDPLVRAEAARAIGTLGGPNDVSVLSQLLRADPEPFVRLQAAIALARIGHERCVPELINGLADLDESVSFECHRALLDMSGQQLPADSKAWNRWFRSRSVPAGQ